MKVYNEWKSMTDMPMNDEQQRAFWKEYLDTEALFYKQLLQKDELELVGTVNELAKEYNQELVVFGGILDGINTSFDEELELEEVEDITELNCKIDKEKLYYNMLDAKAKWLYNLKEWDKHLTKAERLEIKKKFNKDHTVVKAPKIGRNEPCPCGSGKKYKKCCLNKN